MRRRIYIIIGLLVMLSKLADAQVWSSLGNGLPNSAIASTATSKLIATAHYERATDTSRTYSIRVWNGLYWQSLPELTTDAKGVINTLFFFKNGLYIGGQFSHINEMDSSKHLIRWQNREYEAIPSAWRDLQRFDRVDGLNEYEGNLLINGNIQTNNNGEGLSLYNGQNQISFSAGFGKGLGGVAYTASTSDNRLVVGGRFAKANDTASTFIAIYEQNLWRRISNNTILPQKIITHKSETYLCGNQLNGSNRGFYQVSDSTLDTLGTNLERVDKIYDFVNLDGTLYATGIFKLKNIDAEQRLIKWQNSAWQAVTNGNLIGVVGLLNQNNSLIATGFFGSFGVSKLNHVARYISDAGILSTSVFFDKNKDCKLSKDETVLPFAVKISPLNLILKPNDEGRINAILPEGKYTLTAVDYKNWFVNTDCHTSNIEVHIAKGELNDSVHIAMLRSLGKKDLRIQLSSFTGSGARNNARNAYKLTYANIGSQDILSTEVVLRFGDKLSSLSAKPAPDRIQGDSAIWEVSNLFVGETREINLSFNIKGDDGDVINLEASIGLQDEEEDKLDNSSQLSQVLDPLQFDFKKYILNDPQSDTANLSPTTDRVRYQIAFANYTADTVRNVYVVDTIKLNHSMSFIQEIESSHPYTTQVYPGAPGTDIGIVIFTFHNINLWPNPERNDLLKNIGFITFDIGLANNLADGIMLSNTAHVTFDYFDPNTTNTVYAIIDESLVSVKRLEAKALNLYPNPTSNILYTEIPLIENNLEYRITGINGKIQSDFAAYAPQINVQDLASGLYILEVKSKNTMYRSRFIKN